MAVAVTASAALHAVAIGIGLAVVGPALVRKTPPAAFPVSLVYGPGGGGNGGTPDEAPGPSPPPEPAPPPEVAAPAPVPAPVAHPKKSAKPKPAPPPAAASVASRTPTDAASGAPGGVSGGSGRGGGEGGTGGGGFSGASPGYGVNPLPPYPIAARRLGLEGEVLLRVFVAADGRPTNVVVLKSSGHAMLDESAVETVRTRWRFVPATRGGVPVDDTVQVPIRFRQRGG